MKKLFVLVLGLTLLAAACNKPAENTTDTSNNNTNPTATPPAPTPAPAPTPQVQSGTVNIAMTATGYNPANVTVKKGTVVVFKNETAIGLWPASAPHPTHTDYPEFDPKKAIMAGESWSFTFDKVGVWKFHDHLNASGYGFGAVTVVE